MLDFVIIVLFVIIKHFTFLSLNNAVIFMSSDKKDRLLHRHVTSVALLTFENISLHILCQSMHTKRKQAKRKLLQKSLSFATHFVRATKQCFLQLLPFHKGSGIKEKFCTTNGNRNDFDAIASRGCRIHFQSMTT